MKRTLNRILALGMAICMLLSLVVVQASAATTTDGLQSQISAAAGSSVQIVLDGDVTLDQTIQIPAKTAVTITTDGAARTVKRGEGLTAAMFNVPAGSTLTLSGGESRLVLDGASVKASAAMVTSAGTLELTNVDAKNAVNSKTGGAVYLTAGKLSVSGCSFTGNSAKTGGAIDTKTKVGIQMTVADSTFSANTATTNGGAINLMDTNTMTATNTAFTGNKTTKSAANKGGAAVYVANTSASFDGCTFTENTVAGNTDSVGGAVLLRREREPDGHHRQRQHLHRQHRAERRRDRPVRQWQLPQRPGDRELDGLLLHRQQRGRQGRRDCHSVQL